MRQQLEFKSLPSSLKIVFVILILWAFGTLFALKMRFLEGIPFFGITLLGVPALVVVVLLDIIGPLLTVYALCKRKSWGVNVASIYISIFILNSITALITIREELGISPIIIPALVNGIILYLIIKHKKILNK